MKDDINAAETLIGYEFTDKALLAKALIHSSAMPMGGNYERLEFLGDRVLGLIVSRWLYEQYDTADQGELSKRLHRQVCQERLAVICTSLGVHNAVTYEQSEVNIANLPSVQSDVIEAVIAAIYLDGGMEKAEEFVRRNWFINDDMLDIEAENSKSTLQEWSAAQGLGLPIYELVSQKGSDHKPEFTIGVSVTGYSLIMGHGQSRKAAEKQAASKFLNTHNLTDKRSAGGAGI